MILELQIGKSQYKITCEESEKSKLLHLAKKLNERLNKLSVNFKNADEKTLLAISALMIEEELEQKKFDKLQEDSDQLKSDEARKLNDQDIYDAVSENIENISDYIEKLSKKIQNY
jgi:cell division protein ZapA (FtsZ GTPase activity inhibitor)